MLTNKDYCDYDTCVALKELGYDDSTDLRYNSYGSLGDFLSGIKAPTLYEAQKWLREQRLLFIEIDKILYGGYKFHVLDLTTYTEEGCGYTDGYEEALSEGIKEAVKILKKKNINQRKALEAENTEFDYGHNVNYNERDTY